MILSKLFKYVFWLAINFIFLVCLILLVSTVNFVKKLPPIEDVLDDRKRGSVTLLDKNKEVFAWRGNQFGGVLRARDLNQFLHDAIISVEDKRFYSHLGLSLRGILGAIRINLKEGRGPLQGHGGSTITQQVAKTLCLLRSEDMSEKMCRRSTISRKLLEIPFSLALEFKYSKEDILSIYINRVYLGSGAYGFQAASERYFKKSASELSIGQAALLAGLLKAPSKYSPVKNIKRSQARAEVVLELMRDQKSITQAEFEESVSNPSEIADPDLNRLGSYYADWIVQDAPREITQQSKEDLVIQTYFEGKIQKAVDDTITDYIENKISPDSKVQIAAIVMSRNGEVKAMSGGRPENNIPGQFNRAYQAKRQPGSAFKPFVYGAALNLGISPSTIIYDEPIKIIYGKNNEREYSPENYDRKYLGPVTIEQAFSKSLNTIAVKVGNEIGLNRITTLASEMGIKSKLSNDPSLPLGTSEVSLLEITSAYAGFLNDGIQVPPRGWKNMSIRSSGEVIIQEGKSEKKRIISKLAAQSLKYLMYTSVKEGTGKRAALEGWQVAGKTGTSQSFRDAWFIGFTNKYIIGIWMGNDDNQPLKDVNGGGLPASIWAEIMTKITKDHEDQTEITMVTSDQFDILKVYENFPDNPKTYLFDKDRNASGRGTSLIRGLIRALLWGE